MISGKYPRMEWRKLLDTRRIRDFFGGRPTQRVKSELRGEIERDYGRCLFSTPVRRLRDKTQVFPLEPHDSVRTRLAHSLEVSSVARTLAAHAAEFIAERERDLSTDAQRDIAGIAATCGLIHDLGNPPFGHAGELAISSWFEDRLRANQNFLNDVGGEGSQYAKDFLRFEGNAQTLRLLSQLQILSDPYGINLTAASFSAACKYLAPSHRTDHRHTFEKPGFFASEQEIVTAVREATGTLERRNPLTYLIEAADDIVYTTVDLEDGVKKKIFQWDQVEPLLKESRLGEQVVNAARERIADAPPPSSVLGETLAQIFRTIAITEMASIALAAFKYHYDEIMQGEYHGELIADSNFDAAPLADIIKNKILKPLLYTSPVILKLEIRGRTVIHDLMTTFWEAASQNEVPSGTKKYHSKIYLLISENYRRVFEKRVKDAKLPKQYLQLQLATDQVVGMTDTYACQLHKELTNGIHG